MPTLDWLNRQSAFTTSARVPYRLLEQVSVHAQNSVRPEPVEGSPASTSSARTDHQDNVLIQGDNLEALKALLPFYRGQVKCIFIDPPYNTKSAFEHYDDNLEHAQWLSMMLPRLQLLRELLRDDGSIWVTIDDNEGHYLKVLMDEVFGRGNFVANVVWRKNYSPKSTARHISEDHDHILVYAKSGDIWTPNLMPRTDKQDRAYKNPDGDLRGPWKPGDLSARNYYGAGTYPITTPSGRVIEGPPKSMYWRVSEPKLQELNSDNRIWWGKDGTNVPAIKRFLSEVKQGMVPQTYWPYEEVGHTQDAKREVVELFGAEAFGTPKPEALMQRIIHIATNPNDLVLDSFLGSGTTAAVAHKMRRRWIGIEMGEHAATHCLPRLQKVMDGEQGGISKAVEWQGGGGFRFMRLGEAVFDEAGRINPAVRFSVLAAFVWQQETSASFDPKAAKPGTPYLGTYYEISSFLRSDSLGYSHIEQVNTAKFACYLLYNGILGDKRPASGNVLTRDVLTALLALHATTPEPAAPLLVYGEACRLGAERLKQANVTFKHIPYDVRGR